MNATFPRLVLAAFVVTLAACSDTAPIAPESAATADPAAAESSAESISADAPPIEAGRDYHSYANNHEIVVEHVSLDLTVDFAARQLAGTVLLRSRTLAQGANQLVLDARNLTINAAEIHQQDGVWAPLKFSLDEADPNLGSALRLDLPSERAATFEVRIDYRTSPEASGLQWLEPAQTAGKQHPFLFTQSQAIHARSWIPLQDTPAVRVTYDARIRTPANLLAVMSAANDSETPLDGDYSFEMPQAVPSYLIALGVGDLRFESMSERTGVYAEPALLAAAAAEFADTEQMLKISEPQLGAYRWGRYDLLILPPSFPFGGMENPRLSFITPTVIAGDKSLVALIAHELAHSWSGNLITNATWRDLWLNEGFTTYLTSRIMESVYGVDRANMEDALNVQDLKEEMADLEEGDQILAVDMRGRDPDDVFTNVPYVKGQLFLIWLEKSFGRETFDDFLRGYFDDFAFQSITTDVFLEYLQAELLDKHAGTVSRAQVNEWVFTPGIPAMAILPKSDAFTKIDAQRTSWQAGEVSADGLKTDAWTVHEWLHFLNNLPADLERAQLDDLDSTFALTQSRNNEIAHSWLKLAIKYDYEPAYVRLEDYLVSIGRRKLITPLYEELVLSEKGKEFAARVYAVARPGYHPLAQGTVDDILNE